MTLKPLRSQSSHSGTWHIVLWKTFERPSFSNCFCLIIHFERIVVVLWILSIKQHHLIVPIGQKVILLYYGVASLPQRKAFKKIWRPGFFHRVSTMEDVFSPNMTSCYLLFKVLFILFLIFVHWPEPLAEWAPLDT